MKTRKLVIHVPEPERWEVAVANALNFLKTRAEGEDLRVAVIANDRAVTRCTACDPKLFQHLRQLKLDGGEIYLCENSLRRFEIPRERLPDVFGTVPAAVRALADRQADGWCYVRA
ncbi:hypothetical protein G3N55_02660 [Dissulfurirhabdus thermomarina]|uniref:Uncharacterized protein n=1 Tax=Dissulfurirhabdus thermomarina TaxID=1765737 RepID=A0A6N9TPT6_DISTH|nr:DsrE family protein [Dissulfurirhabdus thermomarina]NDY41754.1 hypothetical protein [Dissulfurirhabdus thermomarina]NMX24035.1 hypothetical protein [Dissulfurirhabdus thermomarina]